MWGCDDEGDEDDDGNVDCIFDKVVILMMLIIAIAFDRYVSDSEDDDGTRVRSVD